MKKFVTAAAVSALALTAVPASASIIVGTATQGPPPPSGAVTGFTKLSNPVNLVNVGSNTSQSNGLNTTKVYGFDEKSVTLAANLTVNLTDPSGGTSVLGKGTRVTSHYIFFDPSVRSNAVGSVTFQSRVLGFIKTRNALAATNGIFGLPGVSFANPSAIGLEAGDIVTWMSGDKTVNFDWTAGNPGDHIRVLTAVPEPATWAMMIMGFGLIGGALRSRKANVSVRLRYA